MKIRGFSLTELLTAVVIFMIVLASSYQVFFSGRQSAVDIMESHFVNDDVQKLIDRITNDVRESNFVDPSLPSEVAPGSEVSLKTEDAANRLLFTRVIYDFSKDPATFAAGEKNYTQEKVEYSLERTDVNSATGTYSLIRTVTPWDQFGKAQQDKRTKITLMDDIDELVFYRFKFAADDKANSGARIVFIRLTINRKDQTSAKKGRYAANVVTSVKIRGYEPETTVQ
ncbi:MAG: prepilin-type N-terminal cleavage/methylation domain-containing protein [Candidatus Riflebacteria bacterium]|nr:prepilin-type N-terminal cleavage/methylation domain-containing protein [Candidatus Riflebacteria bacterium]